MFNKTCILVLRLGSFKYSFALYHFEYFKFLSANFEFLLNISFHVHFRNWVKGEPRLCWHFTYGIHLAIYLGALFHRWFYAMVYSVEKGHFRTGLVDSESETDHVFPHISGCLVSIHIYCAKLSQFNIISLSFSWIGVRSTLSKWWWNNFHHVKLDSQEIRYQRF